MNSQGSAKRKTPIVAGLTLTKSMVGQQKLEQSFLPKLKFYYVINCKFWFEGPINISVQLSDVSISYFIMFYYLLSNWGKFT